MYLLNNYIWHPLRHAIGELPQQLRTYVKWYAIVLFIMAVVTAIVVHLFRNKGMVIDELFADPIEWGRLPEHVGVYSYLSATSLIVAGSFVLFAGWVTPELDKAMRWFLLLFGAFVLWLGLDDVFMIHEWVGLRLAWFIQSEDVGRERQALESVVFASYAVAWIGVLVVFSRQIFKTAWILLAFTFVVFSASVVLDLVDFIDFIPSPTTWTASQITAAAEDLSKLAGSLFLLAYAVHTATTAVRGNLTSDPVAK